MATSSLLLQICKYCQVCTKAEAIPPTTPRRTKDRESTTNSCILDFVVKGSSVSRMVGTDFDIGLCPEDKLLGLLHDTVQKLQGLLPSDRTSGAEGPGPQLANGDSTRALKKLFWLLKEWSVLHTHRVEFLSEELNTAARVLMEQEGELSCACTSPGRDTQTDIHMDVSWEPNLHEHISIVDVILNVLEDVKNVEKKLGSVTSKLIRAIQILSDAKLEANNEAKWEDIMIQTNPFPQDTQVCPQTSPEDPCVPEEAYLEYASNISHSNTQGDVLQSIPSTETECCNNPNESSSESQVEPVRGEDDQQKEVIHSEVAKSSQNGDQEMADGEMKNTSRKKVEKAEGGKQLTQSKGDCLSLTQSWATVGLTDSASSSSRVVCYVTGPLEVTKVITCEVVDGLSSLMVSGSEELVSSVLRIEKPCSTKCPFPLSVAVPFRACYRGNYREVTVKVVDQEQRVSYITLAATEGNYGGHRGSFAVARVYTLGVFAVVSRLQKETFTIPKRGLSVKLSVDSRICLDYLPSSFNTPVVAQAMVQPVDTTLLSTLKCRNDSYHSILATSPLLYLNHPSTLTPRRPLSITLPCPPNPDKRKTGEESSHTRPSSIALMSDRFSPHRIRVLSASGKSTREMSKEQLVVLGWKDEQWNILDKISVRNLQNGLVSFEVMDNYERLIVLRLFSSVRPSFLTFFAEDLEESVRTCAVTVVLHAKRQDPSSAVLAVLPNRELSWGLAELRAQAYCGPPDPSVEFSMREGEQLLLKFSGNIAGMGDQNAVSHTVAFHSQRSNCLFLKLKEKDPFGNYSSPHYKGTAILFRIPREQLVWRRDNAIISEDYSLEEPVCKLSLTLPKIVKTPVSAKILRHDQAAVYPLPPPLEPLCDDLLAWLCTELSEEDAGLLVMCLRLRRSSVQLARLRAPDSLFLQTFHILATWRRALPSSTPKHPLLARCLTRIGRPDLAAELLRRGQAVCEEERRGAEPWGLNTLEKSARGHGTLLD